MSVSSKTAALLAAARNDAPNDLARDAMWGRLTLATTLSSVAPPAAKAGAKVAGSKLLLAGAIAGVGASLAVLSALPAEAPSGQGEASPAGPHTVRVVSHVNVGSASTTAALRRRDPATITPEVQGPRTVNAQANENDFAEEARLVSEARSALVAGDPSRALAVLQKTHTFRRRSLEPEELGLEARALHALGRTDEAAAKDFALRRQYPDSALAR